MNLIGVVSGYDLSDCGAQLEVGCNGLSQCLDVINFNGARCTLRPGLSLDPLETTWAAVSAAGSQRRCHRQEKRKAHFLSRH